MSQSISQSNNRPSFRSEKRGGCFAYVFWLEQLTSKASGRRVGCVALKLQANKPSPGKGRSRGRRLGARLMLKAAGMRLLTPYSNEPAIISLWGLRPEVAHQCPPGFLAARPVFSLPEPGAGSLGGLPLQAALVRAWIWTRAAPSSLGI